MADRARKIDATRKLLCDHLAVNISAAIRGWSSPSRMWILARMVRGTPIYGPGSQCTFRRPHGGPLHHYSPTRKETAAKKRRTIDWR